MKMHFREKELEVERKGKWLITEKKEALLFQHEYIFTLHVSFGLVGKCRLWAHVYTCTLPKLH